MNDLSIMFLAFGIACGVLFLGGLWADRLDRNMHRDARRRNRR